MTYPAIAQNRERPAPLPADKPTAVAAQFPRLGPGIVHDAIPAFFIGRNRQGFWVARDVKGRIGGTFLLETSAVSFARRHSEPAGCATIYPSERFELDLEDRGNPLIAPLGSLLRPRAGTPPAGRHAVRAAAARAQLADIRRFILGAVAILAAGAALGTVIALKTAIYLFRLNF